MSLRDLPTRIGLWPEFALLDGIKVPIRGSFLAPKMRRHLMRGGYERAERKLLAELVKEGDVVIELGASLGIVTTLLGKKTGGEGAVVAVEANKQLAPHFRKQLAVNGIDANLIHALACPIWEGAIPEKVRSQGFSLKPSSLSGRAEGPGGDDVPWMTLKEIAEKAGVGSPSVIVIDVEGSEDIWCDQPPCFPQSVRTVIVEIHPHIIGEIKAGESVQALIREGFQVAAISGTVFGLVR